MLKWALHPHAHTCTGHTHTLARTHVFVHAHTHLPPVTPHFSPNHQANDLYLPGQHSLTFWVFFPLHETEGKAGITVILCLPWWGGPQLWLLCCPGAVLAGRYLDSRHSGSCPCPVPLKRFCVFSALCLAVFGEQTKWDRKFGVSHTFRSGLHSNSRKALKHYLARALPSVTVVNNWVKRARFCLEFQVISVKKLQT